MENEINLCEKSNEKCAECVKLTEFDYKKDKVVFYNKCAFACDLNGWKVKDEGRKDFLFEKFVLESFSKVELTNENFSEEYVWTDTGDTLFLRDDEGKLVLWEGY